MLEIASSLCLELRDPGVENSVNTGDEAVRTKTVLELKWQSK